MVLALLYPAVMDLLRPTDITQHYQTLENGQKIVCHIANGYQELGMSCQLIDKVPEDVDKLP